MTKSKLLISNSQQALLAAVQIYNNPLIKFKSELFIVTAMIAWTYLLHAYFKINNIEYRSFKIVKKNKKFEKTKGGDYRYLGLEECINHAKCPLDQNTKNNLLYLLSIRHEVEHKMTNAIDDFISAKFQACCLNFNDFLTSHFNKNFDLADYQTLSLQFSGINASQKVILSKRNLPKNIRAITTTFEKKLSHDEYNDRRYSYRVYLIQKTSNHKGAADEVTEFIKSGSDKETEINRILIKETEKPKFKPAKIIQLMHKEGYKKFNMHHHTSLWKKLDAQNPGKGYGIKLDDGNWYWYENWISVVRDHCFIHKKTMI